MKFSGSVADLLLIFIVTFVILILFGGVFVVIKVEFMSLMCEVLVLLILIVMGSVKSVFNSRMKVLFVWLFLFGSMMKSFIESDL